MTLDPVADESRKMADGAARSRLGFVAETGIFVACLLLCLASCFSFFVFLFFISFPPSRYVYLLRVPSSVQQPFATQQVRIL